jgi:hypothetical protein
VVPVLCDRNLDRDLCGDPEMSNRNTQAVIGSGGAAFHWRRRGSVPG